MSNKIMETLETLEERIESIKWLVTVPFSLISPKKTGLSEAISIIRKSAGLLGKNFPKGTTFENRARRNWETNTRKRMG